VKPHTGGPKCSHRCKRNDHTVGAKFADCRIKRRDSFSKFGRRLEKRYGFLYQNPFPHFQKPPVFRDFPNSPVGNSPDFIDFSRAARYRIGRLARPNLLLVFRQSQETEKNGK
jgi:hypothetical protein